MSGLTRYRVDPTISQLVTDAGGSWYLASAADAALAEKDAEIESVRSELDAYKAMDCELTALRAEKDAEIERLREFEDTDHTEKDLVMIAALSHENVRLRAENARQRAWIDGVMAQKVVDAVDIGTACANLRLVDTRHREIDDALHDIEVRSVKTILRPAPFEDK